VCAFACVLSLAQALSKTVGAMVVDPIKGYLDGDLQDAKDRYSKFLEKQKAVDKSRIEYMKMTTDTGTEFLATKEKALGTRTPHRTCLPLRCARSSRFEVCQEVSACIMHWC
jgi:hypothetical protein